jgi:CheY-like chemotaxis protein
MLPEVLARAFDPFFTTKEPGRGSGLGLSQVYGFARSAGGHVRIESTVGEGTTVRLYLPRSAERPRVVDATPPVTPLAPARGHETVLIVEDDAEVLAIAMENVRALGYRVLTAVDAARALDLLRGEEPVDILFSDVVMPGAMNGAQLAVEARRLRPRLKILLTSGYTAAALSREHGLPQDLEFLSKPYRRDELASKLRVIIGGR